MAYTWRHSNEVYNKNRDRVEENEDGNTRIPDVPVYYLLIIY